MRTHEQFSFGDEVSVNNIPHVLAPLIDQTIAVYQTAYGNDLKSVYVHGSAARGDWRAGVSDLDTVGITRSIALEEEHQIKQQLKANLEKEQKLVAYIEAYVLSQSQLGDKDRLGTVFTLAACGVCVWGDSIDFASYLPTLGEVHDNYLERTIRHVSRFRQGLVTSQGEVDDTLLARRYAKFALRVLHMVAVGRGSVIYTSQEDQVKSVAENMPQVHELLGEICKMLNNKSTKVDHSIDLLTHSLEISQTM